MSPLDAERLRTLRKERGLTQQQLERASGVHQAMISRIEKGTASRVTVEMLEHLADALDVEPADLLRRKPKKRT